MWNSFHVYRIMILRKCWGLWRPWSRCRVTSLQQHWKLERARFKWSRSCSWWVRYRQVCLAGAGLRLYPRMMGRKRSTTHGGRKLFRWYPSVRTFSEKFIKIYISCNTQFDIFTSQGFSVRFTPQLSWRNLSRVCGEWSGFVYFVVDINYIRCFKLWYVVIEKR